MLDSAKAVQVIDTRPRHYTTKAHEIVRGAVWRDPERVDEWIGELSTAEILRSSGQLRLRKPTVRRLAQSFPQCHFRTFTARRL
jgi:hypothetical protein